MNAVEARKALRSVPQANRGRLAQPGQSSIGGCGRQIHLELRRGGQVSDLSPLRGMPLTSFGPDRCRQVRDLTPLQGMPLTSLNLTDAIRYVTWRRCTVCRSPTWT